MVESLVLSVLMEGRDLIEQKREAVNLSLPPCSPARLQLAYDLTEYQVRVVKEYADNTLSPRVTLGGEAKVRVPFGTFAVRVELETIAIIRPN
jgi:hypothetical protein